MGCAGSARKPRKRWIFIVCDWLVNFILPLLSFFVVMFCLVLFGVWYCPKLSWWLVAADIVLIACMGGVTVMFAIGRLPGWIAHWREQNKQGAKIARPRQIYTGPAKTDFVPMENR